MKIPTAEELLQGEDTVLEYRYYTDYIVPKMVEFTKLHLKAALEAAHTQAIYNIDTNAKEFKDSILNAYPETNIK